LPAVLSYRELARAIHGQTGYLPPLPGIFPDFGASIIRESAEGRELVLARWGMPSPLFALKGKKTNTGCDIDLCPCCGGRMLPYGKLPPCPPPRPPMWCDTL
jgi:hypothetical protein